MADDLTETLDKNAQGPKSVKGDSAEVEQHSLPDQIAWLKFRASQKATTGKSLGIRITKFVPPGAP